MLSYIYRSTGEVIAVELFVCCLGASGFAFADPTPSQQAEDFVQSYVRAFDYFDGVPAATVPDNLKSGVKRSDRYEPTIAQLYSNSAAHYGFVVLPRACASRGTKRRLRRRSCTCNATYWDACATAPISPWPRFRRTCVPQRNPPTGAAVPGGVQLPAGWHAIGAIPSSEIAP